MSEVSVKTAPNIVKARMKLVQDFGKDVFSKIGILGGIADHGNNHKRGFGSHQDLAKKFGAINGRKNKGRIRSRSEKKVSSI